MNVPWQIVIASADLEDRRTMVNILEKQELDPIVASSVAECQQNMAQDNVGLIFCARSLADGDYRDLLLAARASKRRTRIVLTARITDWDEYLDAMRKANIKGALVGVEAVTPEGLKAVFKDFNYSGDALAKQLQTFKALRALKLSQPRSASPFCPTAIRRCSTSPSRAPA